MKVVLVVGLFENDVILITQFAILTGRVVNKVVSLALLIIHAFNFLQFNYNLSVLVVMISLLS